MDIAKVLILGRPNVGKSTLINRILKRKSTITFDQPGVTRDLNEHLVEFNNKSFLLVDSGGILAEHNEAFEFQDQVEAIVSASLHHMSAIIFVVDAQDGLCPADKTIATLLRRQCAEKVIVVCNKADNNILQETLSDYYSLGFGDPIPVSAIHGNGIDTLLSTCTRHFTVSDAKSEQLNKRFKVGIVGRPNVGKSSLLNSIIDAEHSIVNPKSGTTRDAIHVFFKQGEYTFELIDTAGIRRQSKVKRDIEFYSVVRSKRTIQDADILVLILDADRGFSHQDKRIIQLILDAGKSMIIFVNKIDTLEEGHYIQKDFKTLITSQMKVLENYPICFGSALLSQGVDSLLKKIPPLFEGINERIPTKVLNDFNQEVIRRFPPPAKYGKQVKVYYLTQVSTLPPTFICFINHKKYLTEDYKRFLERRFRQYLGGFMGHTIRLFFKERPSDDKRAKLFKEKRKGMETK